MRRRQWLQLGLGTTAVLAAGGAFYGLTTPGLINGRLAPAGRTVLIATGEAILDASLPPRDARPRALQQLLERVDALIFGLPDHVRQELSQLLTVLASSPGRRILAGLQQPWDEAELPHVQHALQGMRTSSLSLPRQAYQALHELSTAAWFSDPSTWGRLGYPGPRPL